MNLCTRYDRSTIQGGLHPEGLGRSLRQVAYRRSWADPPGHVTFDACWETTPPPCGQTNICQNITSPQISFAAVIKIPLLAVVGK